MVTAWILEEIREIVELAFASRADIDGLINDFA